MIEKRADAQTQGAQARHARVRRRRRCRLHGAKPLVRTARALDIANPVGLPESFTLVIEADHFMRHCHAVWSSEQRIGVAFDCHSWKARVLRQRFETLWYHLIREKAASTILLR